MSRWDVLDHSYVSRCAPPTGRPMNLTIAEPGVYSVAGPRRGTPDAILLLAARICKALTLAGWCQRNGIAAGFDQACYDVAGEDVSLYLPWPGFRRLESEYRGAHIMRSAPTARAVEIAGEAHPAWHACDRSARQLHGRNTHIILGADCEDPSAFLLCYTRDGYESGGTGQTIRVAMRNGVRVDNLYFADVRSRWESVI